MPARSRWRVRGFARVFAATDFRVAATAFARPCRTRSSCPSAHWPAGAGGRRGVAWWGGGAGFAEVAGQVNVIDQEGHFEAAPGGLGLDGGDLLLVPVDEEEPLADPLRVAAAGLVAGR